ncbi:MAG: hypothetical protein KJ964_02655 [Verrucomicrobia bacterium]|nr:hypothetical protein [Verrucomicrobiota bacterium]MBU1735318.1 hypothetical protein [Verrucomicrobiota bacterium]MBU1858171.1 hypothetical protein [Verrucomicrobiota bacterium]
MKTRVATRAVPVPTSGDRTEEAPLRASAVVFDVASKRFCFVSCDTLIIPEDVLASAAPEIVRQAAVSFENLLICATHTHHAPSTIDILGFKRDKTFCDHLAKAIIQSAVAAARVLDNPRTAPDKAQAELAFAETQEATVGMNSRYLLKDGSIGWYAYAWEDVVRPTGPYDPDLAVLAFRRPAGELAGLIFNHSVHNIGSLSPNVWSPAFYGLTARELERRLGATTIFLPGAFGSTHNTSEFGCTPNPRAVSTRECVHRLTAAVEHGLRLSRPLAQGPVKAIKRPFKYRVRRFDEAKEAATVKSWGEKYAPDVAEALQRDFHEMRVIMGPLQGREQQAWLQTIRLGDVALVGVPGELFASLGLEIRRRSPFRWTYLVGLANGTLGYIGDRAGYELGGYQLWAGQHSLTEPGTGETLVDQAVAMLGEL